MKGYQIWQVGCCGMQTSTNNPMIFVTLIQVFCDLLELR